MYVSLFFLYFTTGSDSNDDFLRCLSSFSSSGCKLQKFYVHVTHTHTCTSTVQSQPLNFKIVIHVKPAKIFYVQDLSLLDTCKRTRIFACHSGISMISSSQSPKKLFKVPLQKSSFLP